MTTYTSTGFLRTVNYETGDYSDFTPIALDVIRPDGQDSFVYQYNWIDDSDDSLKFANIFDIWTHSAVISHDGVPYLDLADDTYFLETFVYQVEWAPGMVANVLAFFEMESGTDLIFFFGDDQPVIASLEDMNAFLDLPSSYILSGDYESGNAIPFTSFANSSSTEDDLVVAYEWQTVNWDGGIGNDTITGGLNSDTLLGGAGDDVLSTGGGSDTLWGGLGNDTLYSGGNFSQMLGGEGNDVLIGLSTFGDLQDGGAGNDLIQMTDGQDFGGGVWVSHGYANGGSGADTIVGGRSGDGAFGGDDRDLMQGNDGDDWLMGGAGVDTIEGGIGNDQLFGGKSNDFLYGGDGNDLLNGGGKNDRLFGDSGDDSLYGDTGDDRLYGGTQNDLLDGGIGNDVLYGDVGRDHLIGGDGLDTLYGGFADDTLDGGFAADLLMGEGGNDALSGGGGVDTLVGGAGVDTMEGGAHADTFVFTSVSESLAATWDTIVDFVTGLDKIDLSQIDANALLDGDQAFDFVGTGPVTNAGQVRLDEFGGDTLVQVNTTGALGFDMAILLQGTTGLSATDFIL